MAKGGDSNGNGADKAANPAGKDAGGAPAAAADGLLDVIAPTHAIAQVNAFRTAPAGEHRRGGAGDGQYPALPQPDAGGCDCIWWSIR